MWKEAAAAAAAIAGVCLARSQYERKALSAETVCLSLPGLKGDHTLVFLSDLHNNEFGEGNERLLAAIEEAAPQAVLCGGDMLVSRGGRADDSVPFALLASLARRYPVFCGNGNHEERLRWRREQYGDQYEAYRDRLRAAGVVYLEDNSADFGPDLRISALDLAPEHYRKALWRPAARMDRTYLEQRLGEAGKGGRCQLLLAHSPLYFDAYTDWGADLTLAGHFHGGTIRLPGLGGVMTPQYQFFRRECAGTLRRGRHVMVVSRGLGTHSINIRLNNRPQLVILQLRRDEHGNDNL